MLEISLRTLTPLWTGDVKRLPSTVREAGLIGSLRWWYEALVRGWGGGVCTPDSRCQSKDCCDVCRVFGCTGWSRRFRLIIPPGEQQRSPSFQVCTRRRHWGWPIGGILADELCLRFLPTRRGDSDWEDKLALLIRLVSKQAGLGARSQLGCGIVQIKEIKKDEEVLLAEKIEQVLQNALPTSLTPPRDYSPFPDIRDFFFCKFKVPSQVVKNRGAIKGLGKDLGKNIESKVKECCDWGFIPAMPALRSEIRGWLRDKCPGLLISGENLENLRHDLMGRLGMGAKIFVSNIYKLDDGWEFRIWGWIPASLGQYGVGRVAILNYLKEKFPELAKVLGCESLRHECYEFDRSRDDIRQYLLKLAS